MLGVVDILSCKYAKRSLSDEEHQTPRPADAYKEADDQRGKKPLLYISIAKQRQMLRELASALYCPGAAKR